MEPGITANSIVLYIFTGQKPSRDFSFHSSFITYFRDSTNECAFTVQVDIQKKRLSMQDTDSVIDFSTHYHKLQWLLALAENKKWQLRSEKLGAIFSQTAGIFYSTPSHLSTTLSLLSSLFKSFSEAKCPSTAGAAAMTQIVWELKGQKRNEYYQPQKTASSRTQEAELGPFCSVQPWRLGSSERAILLQELKLKNHLVFS